MIIDTNGFEIGDDVWIKISTPNPLYSSFHPFLYGKAVEDSGFSVTVIINDGSYMNVCHSNCFHTEQQCQLACDRLNGVSHD